MTESNGTPVGPTVGAGLGAVGGAGCNFDPDQIAALIPKWEAFKDTIREDYLQLQAAWTDATAPSPDQPAVRNAEQTRASVAVALEHNRAMYRYASTWLDHLKKANGTYVEQDQEIERGLYGAGGDVNGHGLY